ncbi:MAG: DMT family transporter [candidate division WOR-3 bacterium]|nr:DMT family transporter [candidate division WOR-3 bacterium]
MTLIKNIGEIAAIGTAFCWSFGSIFFTIAGRQIGANVVNRTRLVLALLLLMLVHLINFGSFLPIHASSSVWFWFGLSGIIGFTIGDTMLFNAFVYVGPRLSMLMMSLVPVFGTIIAWFLLNELLSLPKIIAIIITLAGISWVVFERRNVRLTDRNKAQLEAHYLKGILFGLGGAFCQALGLFFSKKGLANNFSPISGNLIRILIATATIWIIPSIQGKVIDSFKKLSNSKARLGVLGGAIFGPFLGVWLSLIAIQHAYIGIASTLMALPPIILLPLSYWIFKEEITPRAIFGTIIAIIGVALLFLI